MSLGPQCWACKSRRVRCDSAEPNCEKCNRKGIACPGYSAARPFRWVNKITPESLLRSGPQVGQLMRGDDVAPAHIIMDVVTYYNSHIAPDLSACAPTDHAIAISGWLDMITSLRHLYTCAVALHKAIQSLPEDVPLFRRNTTRTPMHKALAMYHHHQACAARLLRNQIQRLSGPPDSALFSAIISFLTSSIQKSAYGTWRAHLNGASTLLDMWGMQSLLKSDQFIFYIFMTTDIFGMTTSPSTFLTPTAVDHHHSYLIFISQLRIKTWSSLTPIPDDLLIAIISMNIRRADSMHVHGRMGCDCKSTGMTVTSILAYTQAFSPENWAAGICSTPGSPQLAGWSLLARCFQGAVCLYILLCDTSFSTEECCGGRRNKFLASTYMSVATCIHKLFDRRYCAGNFHKFLLWPMVITGVEAVAQHDRTEIEFLCQELRAATISLGTMAMREAAVFLEHLWSITWTDCQTSDRIIFDWNVVFERAPIFMM